MKQRLRSFIGHARVIGRELVLCIGDLLQMALVAAVIALALLGAHIFDEAEPPAERAAPAKEVRL